MGEACTVGGRSSRWVDAGLVLLLLLVAGGVRAWLVAHTSVMARDGIGFIHYAWQLETQPWRDVLRGQFQHPLYPVSIVLMSWPVRHLWPGPLTETMRLSAQLAGCLAGVLLVIPMYFLGKALLDRRVGFWAALLFQCLPVSVRATADALSEGVYLFWAAMALLAAVHALRRRSPLLFAVCGILGGLAYLTRPEGAFPAVAGGLVLVGSQAFAAWRGPWRRTALAAVSLVVGGLVTAGPYMVVIGKLTPKPTVHEALGQAAHAAAHEDGIFRVRFTNQSAAVWPGLSLRSPGLPRRGFEDSAPATQPGQRRARASGPLLASLFAVWRPDDYPPDARHRLGWSLWAVGTELDKAYHHVAWLLVLLGLYWTGSRLTPAAWVALLVCLLQGLAVWRLALKAGYVAERHMLIIVICTLPWAVAGALELPRRLTAWRAARAGATARRGLGRLPASAWSVILLLALAGSGLPKMLEPLHPQRAGHRLAGEWLAGHLHPGDMIEDPYHWARYYAGTTFQQAQPCPSSPLPGWNHYVILEKGDSQHTRLAHAPPVVHEKGVAAVDPAFPLYEHKKRSGEVEILRCNWTAQPLLPPEPYGVPSD
jgi:hypothetical protein